MELVSVIIPAYNAERTIERTVNSIMQQTYSEIEIIIINDGSWDNTDFICREMVEKDLRIKYYRIKNGGVSNARNTGLSVANGKYISFIDADDYVKPEFLEDLVGQMDENTDLVCEGYIAVHDDGVVLFKQTLQEMRFNKDRYHEGIEILQNKKAFNVLWNKLFRRSIIDQNEIKMDTTISMGEDLLFMLEYLNYAEKQICLSNKTDYKYVLSGNGLQATFKDDTDLRLVQLDKIREWYVAKSYPMKGFYIEALRTFYVAVLGTKNVKETFQCIVESPTYKEMRLQKLECEKKFKLFWKLLNTENTVAVNLCVKIFRLQKVIRGQAYKW